MPRFLSIIPVIDKSSEVFIKAIAVCIKDPHSHKWPTFFSIQGTFKNGRRFWKSRDFYKWRTSW
jgi:glucuronate isomerase